MDFLYDLEKILKERKIKLPPNSYTSKLFSHPEARDKILKKIGEEAGEVIIAGKNNRSELVYESADLLFHLILLLVQEGIDFNEIIVELQKRNEKS